MRHGSVRTGTRFLRAVIVLATAAVLVSGCKGLGEGDSSTGAGPTEQDGRAISPLKNPDGTKPGLAPVTADADQETARKLIEELSTKGRGPKTGYARPTAAAETDTCGCKPGCTCCN